MAEFSKISIPGPTLSSLLHHSSPTAGLLFGHVTALPSAGPTDDDEGDPTLSSTSTTPALSLTITSFISTPFFDSLALPTNPSTNPRSPNPNSALIGWFSSRPSSPLRPSIRDLAVSHHLSQTLETPTPDSKSCAFFLLSSFTTPNLAVHTHEYRAFMYAGSRLRPISVDVINVGPKFRGQYGGFMPESSVMFPMIRVPLSSYSSSRALDEGKMDVEGGGEAVDGEWEVEGFGVERLEGMMGAEYTRELEDLYGKMMGKLDGLVRMVEASSAQMQEQESRNSVLRNKIAGLE